MEQLPFPLSVRAWDELTESERGFFWLDDEYFPLHQNHAAQIGLLTAADTARLAEWAISALPPGWPDQTDQRFESEEQLSIEDFWDPEQRGQVRQWLFKRGIPFRTNVYLIYGRDRVVRTTWRMLVRYWDAFSWSVGYAMVVMDHTLQWACCFHHEDVIVFGRRG